MVIYGKVGSATPSFSVIKFLTTINYNFVYLLNISKHKKIE
jgi:hypothetical protein